MVCRIVSKFFAIVVKKGDWRLAQYQTCRVCAEAAATQPTRGRLGGGGFATNTRHKRDWPLGSSGDICPSNSISRTALAAVNQTPTANR
ncbi:hypothetical protein Pla100_57640 [Neorhodopirellula pilleata]|uniref:Uncharacterized protein n=1 Tax=Neorhodopirellula pilleata TaxID=2714738 RepID=A0A5C5ZNM8_9BACT|nr:hypothetical protein Pla100_57640 [Neorhodopirellula pilleata]